MATIIEVTGSIGCGKTIISSKIHLILSGQGYKVITVDERFTTAGLEKISENYDVIIIDKDIK